MNKKPNFIIRFIIGFVVFIIGSSNIFGQLINIESRRMLNDTVRFASSLSGNFSYLQNNNKQLYQYAANAVVQMRGKGLKSIYLITGAYEKAQLDRRKINDAGFIHLRFTQKFNKFFRWEAFTQLQNNQVLLLEKRFLAGTGPRLKLIKTEMLNSSLGILYMFENEVSKEFERRVVFNHHRISAYLTLTMDLKKYEFRTITYYQPRLDEFSDFRLTHQSSFEFFLGKKLSFVFDVRYQYDAYPPPGILEYNLSTSVGLKANL